MKTQHRKRNRFSDPMRRRGAAIGLILLFAVGGLWLAGARAQEEGDAGPDIEQTREMLAQWVQNERIIAKEKRDLVLAKEVLNERIALVKREIESLRGKIADARKSITEADEKRAEMMQENDKLKEASVSLVTTAGELEAQTQALLDQLPEIFQKRVKPLSQQFPKDPKNTKQSLSVRFQNILGVMNELNKVNREITVTSEVRKLTDDASAEVTVMYVGIGRAYYVSGNGEVAGVGLPSPEGWVWKPANEVAKQIQQAIAILKNEQPAAFVQLPIEIK